MKMDRNAFAVLIGYLSHHGFDSVPYTVREVDNMIDIEVPVPALPPKATCAEVDSLMIAIKHDKRIEAIKSYRVLTGAGLLESKNAVEAHAYFPPRSATLGDILPKKTAKQLKSEMRVVIDAQIDNDNYDRDFVLKRFDRDELDTIIGFIDSFND